MLLVLTENLQICRKARWSALLRQFRQANHADGIADDDYFGILDAERFPGACAVNGFSVCAGELRWPYIGIKPRHNRRNRALLYFLYIFSDLADPDRPRNIETRVVVVVRPQQLNVDGSRTDFDFC